MAKSLCKPCLFKAVLLDSCKFYSLSRACNTFGFTAPRLAREGSKVNNAAAGRQNENDAEETRYAL